MHRLRLLRTWQYPFILFADKSFHLRSEQIVQINDGIRPINVAISAANRLIGEVVQSRRRPLLGSPHLHFNCVFIIIFIFKRYVDVDVSRGLGANTEKYFHLWYCGVQCWVWPVELSTNLREISQHPKKTFPCWKRLIKNLLRPFA